jgi:adenosylhomocysteine nucleosidase
MLGIMSATQDESAAVVDALSAVRVRQLGQRRYHVGLLHGTPVAVVFSRWGKVAAAATATQLIATFEVSQLVFSGVAGAIQSGLGLGDVVVGAQLLQHDMDATPIYPRYEVPLLGTTRFATDEALRARLSAAVNLFVRADLPRVVPAEVRGRFGISAPQVIAGTIASGDKFFSGAAQVAELRQRLPEVACVDMEGAAVAQVCAEYAVPFGIVRTISDSADHNAEYDFSRFSREVAGQYSLGIVQRLLAEG